MYNINAKQEMCDNFSKERLYQMGRNVKHVSCRDTCALCSE